MGFYNFLGVLEIIKGSIIILPKNGKVMASIATLGLLLNSFTFFLYIFFFKPLHEKSTNLDFKNLSESEFANLLHDAEKDSFILIGVSFSYLIIYSLIARFIIVSIVYASLMSLCGHDISLKDLILRVIRSFKRILTPSFRLTSRSIIWIIVISTVTLVVTFLAFPYNPLIIVSVFITLMVPTFIYMLYISAARVLSFVVLVVEESCDGNEALMKAEELVKGRRVDAFVLTLAFNLFLVIIFFVYEIIATKWPSKELITGLFGICIAYLAIMFVSIAYTFLYFECKKSHGEEVEFLVKLEYSKVPTIALLGEDVP